MRKLLIVVFMCVVLVVAGEAMCRLLGLNDNYRQSRPSRISREDSDLVYRLRENLDIEAPLYNVLKLESDALSGHVISTFRVRTNALGLREEQVLPGVDHTSPIIMCMGDSVTFGWGANDNESYPRLLEDILRRGGDPRLRVINAAQPGFSSCQGLHFYRRVLREIPADFVIVAFGHNDHSVAIQGYRSARDKFTRLSRGAGRVGYVLRRSDFYLCWVRLVTGISGRCRMAFFPGPPPGLDNPGSVTEFAEHLTGLIDAIRGDARGVLLLTQPRNTEESTWRAYNQTIARVAEETGTPLFDAGGLFASLPDGRNDEGERTPPPNDLFLDDIHLTLRGNAILARGIADYLRDQSIPIEIRRGHLSPAGGNVRIH